jgi:folylpolyglutamate synthase/dihydropteroate synthase
VGLAADKDPHAFFGPLLGLYDSLTLIDLPQARKPQTAHELQTKINMAACVLQPDIEAAVKAIDLKTGKICIAGSLYLYQMLVQ